VTYRVRVDLKGNKPPVWRRLELASDLLLSEVHALLQAAFGWEDYHLHRFAIGPSVWDRAARYSCARSTSRRARTGPGCPGGPLDEVLVAPDDRLLRVYDYGDGWEHVIRLDLAEADEAVRGVIDGADMAAGLPPLVAAVWTRLAGSPAGDGIAALVLQADLADAGERGSRPTRRLHRCQPSWPPRWCSGTRD
jgi:hypothetical protein